MQTPTFDVQVQTYSNRRFVAGFVWEQLYLQFSFASFYVATSLQYLHFRLGLLIGACYAGGFLLFSFILFFFKGRKFFPHVLEVVLAVVLTVQLGLAYRDEQMERTIRRLYNFITLSTLTGATLLSLVTGLPLAVQPLCESTPRALWPRPEMHHAAGGATLLMAFAFLSADVLYLVPICLKLENHRLNALTLVFREIWPCASTALGLLSVSVCRFIFLRRAILETAPENAPRYLRDGVVQEILQQRMQEIAGSGCCGSFFSSGAAEGTLERVGLSSDERMGSGGGCLRCLYSCFCCSAEAPLPLFGPRPRFMETLGQTGGWRAPDKDRAFLYGPTSGESLPPRVTDVQMIATSA